MASTGAPLWMALEKVTGERQLNTGDSVALVLYSKMEALLGDQCCESDIREVFSLSQYNSFRIIREWWDCSIEEDQWFRGNHDRARALELLKMYPAIEAVSPLVAKIALQIEPSIPNFSTYRLLVYRLFMMEFDPGEARNEEPERFETYLQAQRDRAAFYASVQRFCFPFLHGSSDQAETHVESSSTGKCFDSVSAASIQPCPWLDVQRDRSSYPYYLWDVKRKRTVAVNTLKQVPDYVCISHTWGRWHDPTEPFAFIVGVPWLVPRNSRFNVGHLPRMLEHAFPVEYIWLDLVCIPQDRSKLALIEISRQAKIFGMAKAAIIWLWEVIDWAGMQAMIEWLVMFSVLNRGDGEQILPEPPLHQHTGIVVEEQVSNAENYTPIGWFTSLWTLQEACLRPDMLLCNRDFTILTFRDIRVTLDSVAAILNFSVGFYPASPFETLVNRDRSPEDLEIGTVAELEQLNPPGSFRRRRALDKIPENIHGFREIYEVFAFSGLSTLHTLSPVAVFYLGQRRECLSRRAEAIMSVIGATDWFTSYMSKCDTSPPEESLIHDMYPAEFINEAARKIGAVFFATVTSNLSNLENAVSTADGKWIPIDSSRGVGSMLPFTKTPTVVVSQQHHAWGWYGHPSVSSWLIDKDGKIHIRKAGVLGASHGTNIVGSDCSVSNLAHDPLLPSEVLAAIHVPEIFSTTLLEPVNLTQWLRTFWAAEESPNFAVSVIQQTKRMQWGLILKAMGRTQTLVKIGTFLTASLKVEDVPTTIVNWVVL